MSFLTTFFVLLIMSPISFCFGMVAHYIYFHTDFNDRRIYTKILAKENNLHYKNAKKIYNSILIDDLEKIVNNISKETCKKLLKESEDLI